MRRHTSRFVTAGLASALGILGVAHAASAQSNLFQPDIPVPPYNPYPALPGFNPPSILPPDLQPEIYRVRREVETIFDRYFAEWQALTPPVLSNTQGEGNPPVLQGTGYDAVRILGGLLNYDENMSPFQNQACSFCHMPYAGFSGPIPSVNLTMVAYPGSYRYHANKLTAQRYTYSHTFPVLNFNTTQQLFFGGNFWDGRATGYKLQSADAEQAQGPPVDPLEMGNPDTACIAYKISLAPYRRLFELVWGDSFNIQWPADTAQICGTPNGAEIFGGSATPLGLSRDDRTKATNIFDHWGQSLSFLERSFDISPFNSKFDFFLKGDATLTADEMAGFQLFNGKGNCNSCHVDGRGTTLQPGQVDTSTTATANPPIFTCFGSANEGLPLNPRNAFYYQTTPDSFGFIGNPYGFGYRDLGMGTFLRSGFGSAPNPNQNWIQFAPMVDGQFQVATVRNVAMTPPQCPTTEAGKTDAHGNPIPYFQKEFFHNGYIKSLKQLVHFYNTRDTKFAYPVTSGHCPPGTIERVTCWPMKEVPNNLDTTTGMLALSETEENQIVAFLETLTDGYTAPYPNSDTFTGQCATCDPATDPNCSPSRQGNGELIPTPPLPPCAPAICGGSPTPSPAIQ